jgi:hypothetical protein
LTQRQARTKPLWEKMFAWLTLERQRVPDGSGTARALDYSLNPWNALSANLRDGNGAGGQQPPGKPDAALGHGPARHGSSAAANWRATALLSS